MRNTHKVIVKKHVSSGCGGMSSRDGFLKKELELPFAPFKGLSVSDGDWEAVIDTVHFDLKKGVFVCYTESDNELRHRYSGPGNYPADEVRYKDLAEIVKGYVENGWRHDS